MPDFELENQNVQETVKKITYNFLSISSDFLERIRAIEDQSVIAKFIFTLIVNNVDIVPNENGAINYLGVSIDDPTKISYLTYERANSAYDKGEASRIWEDKNYRYHSGAGKVIRKLLSAVSTSSVLTKSGFASACLVVQRTYADFQIPEENCLLSNIFTEAQFDLFNNLFRIEGYRQGDTGEVIFVKGHWIKELYNEKNYASLSGTLGNSCMRHERTGNYLDIYVKNPSICKLAVLLNSDGKVQGRAIVWTVDGVDYYDRIYYTSDLIHDKMKAFFLVNGIKTCAAQYPNFTLITINADTTNKDFDKRVLLDHSYYPYMDNVKYLSEDKTFITNDESIMDNRYYTLNCTGGGSELVGNSMCSCDNCGSETDEDDICYIDVRRDDNYGENYCNECAVYSDYHNGYITRNDAVYLESESSYVLESQTIVDYLNESILNSRAVELVDGRYAHQEDPDLHEYITGGWFITESDFEYVEHNGDYYRLEDCVEDRNGDTYPEHLTTEYEGEIWLHSDLDEHLNLNLI
jgi:hypothetical protein